MICAWRAAWVAMNQARLMFSGVFFQINLPALAGVVPVPLREGKVAKMRLLIYV
jgi:hypothetical protein